MAGELLSLLSRGLASSLLALLGLVGCTSEDSDSGLLEVSTAQLCGQALALPVLSAAQLLVAPDQLPELRNRAYALLDLRAPDTSVTEAAHDVAMKTVLAVDVAEGVLAESDDILGLVGQGVDGLVQLSAPVQEVFEAQIALTEACLLSEGTSASPQASNVYWMIAAQ